MNDASFIEYDYFSPEEFKQHFSKVSENLFERSIDDILQTAEKTSLQSNEKALTAAHVVLSDGITWKEFDDELAKKQDCPTGTKNITISGIKIASPQVKERIFRCLIHILDLPAEEWPRETKYGWVIPLHNKGAKNNLNNCRGVCLLPLASRSIARICASRLKTWAEEIRIPRRKLKRISKR